MQSSPSAATTTTPTRAAAGASPRRTVLLGLGMMIVAALAMLATILIAYPYAAHFSLPAQIAAHMLLPVAAGVLKLGYVVRLAGHHANGNYAAG